MDIICEAKRQSTIRGTKKSIGFRFYRKCSEMWVSPLVWSCSTYGHATHWKPQLWVWDIFTRRELHGEFHWLVQELKLGLCHNGKGIYVPHWQEFLCLVKMNFYFIYFKKIVYKILFFLLNMFFSLFYFSFIYFSFQTEYQAKNWFNDTSLFALEPKDFNRF